MSAGSIGAHIRTLLCDWLSPDDTCPSVTYLMCNALSTKPFYIGRTANATTRPHTHYKSIWRAFAEKHPPGAGAWTQKADSRKYDRMARAHPWSWVWIPIARVDAPSAPHEELRLIKRFQPPLNTAGRRVHRARTRPLISIRTRADKRLKVTSAPILASPRYRLHFADCTGPAAYHSLFALLRACESLGQQLVTVVVFPHVSMTDPTPFKALRRSYGHCAITLHISIDMVVNTDLRRATRILRQYACVFTLRSVSRDRTNLRRTQHILRRVCYGHSPFKMPALIRMHPMRLMWIFTNAHCLPQHACSRVRRMVLGLLKGFHHVPPLTNLCIKIPFNHYSKSVIRLHVNHLVRQTILPTWLKDYITGNYRIVFTKRPSIAKIMCNLISATKSFTPTAPQCTCSRIMSVLDLERSAMPTLDPPLDGHVSIRASALPPHLAFLRQSLSNVPVPTHIDANKELCAAFRTFYRQVCLFHLPDRMAGDTYTPKGVSTPYAAKLVFRDQRGMVDVVYYERTIATITRHRYELLRSMYFATRRAQPRLWHELAVRSCHEEIVKLHMRYHAAVRKHHPHCRLIDLLSEYVQADCQIFMSPFAVSGHYHYTSTFARDALFGALCDPYNYRWHGVVVGAPPPTRHHVNRSLVQAMASCYHTRTPSAAVLILPEIGRTLLSFALSLRATTLIARFTSRGGVHGQRGQRFVVLVVANRHFADHEPLQAKLRQVHGYLRLRHVLTYFNRRLLRGRVRFGGYIFPRQRIDPYGWARTVRAPIRSRPLWRVPRDVHYRSSNASVNLSNALNGCFARPSDTTIQSERCFIHEPSPGIVPSPRRLERLRRALGDSIVGYQDKNPGACTIECPLIQWRREQRMYYSWIVW